MTIGMLNDGATVQSLVIEIENKYGKLSRDMLNMPFATWKAYLTSGMAHSHGNVVASAVVSEIKKTIAGKDRKAADVTTDEVKAWRKENADAAKAMEQSAFADSVKDADAGEIGVREGGPRLDPVEREFRSLVLARAKSICETIGAALPGVAKNGEAAPTILFPGDNVNLTREQLLDRIANSNKPGNGGDLRKQAKATVEARARIMQRGVQDAANTSTEALF